MDGSAFIVGFVGKEITCNHVQLNRVRVYRPAIPRGVVEELTLLDLP